jgi:beta-lactamase class A
MNAILWEKLSESIEWAAAEFDGVMGVSIKDLTTGDALSVNGDEQFLAASSIKIPILIELYKKARAGTLDLGKEVTVHDDVKVGGTGVIKELGNVTLTMQDIITLMITVSDNTATNMLIDVAVMDDVNATMKELGLSVTRLLRKMQDYEAIAQGKENYSTPNEFMRLMEALHTCEGLDPWIAEQALAVLKKPKTTTINRLLPYDVEIASKYGNMRNSYCDVALVYHPQSPYIISVMTKYIPTDDVRKQRTIDAISEVSKTAYDHFNATP